MSRPVQTPRDIPMKTPEDRLSITVDAVQTFAPFDYVAAQSRRKPQGAGTAFHPAASPARASAPAARHSSFHAERRFETERTAPAFLREALTIIALAGMLWFQYEIVRCFW